MATHNGQQYVKEQIDSILCQLSDEDELIVSDDGSTDGTCDIISQYRDKRVKFLKFVQPEKLKGQLAAHRYASRNFENALSNAKGDYIFLCDQDDVWMPNKVAKCVALLQNAILVKHRGERIDSVGKMLNKQSATLPMSSSLVVNWYRLYVPGSHIAFRKELLNIALPFPSCTVSHDGWIGCLACYIGKCVDIDEALIKYRIHTHNVSVGRKNKFWVKIGYRISLLLALITRIAKNL